MSDTDKLFPEFNRLERLFAESVLLGLLDASKTIDKFSSWILAAVAASLVVILSNIDTIKELIGARELQVFIALLSISVLFGLAQKERHINLQVSLTITDSVKNRIRDMVKETGGENSIDAFKHLHDHMNIVNGILCIVTGFPDFAKPKIVQRMVEKNNGPLDMKKYQNDTFSILRQVLYMWLQIAVSIAAIVILIFSLN
ncbi:MAG: hypothetical protein N0C81_03105 [Candidatus Thiodiazotropha lotti]|uniref:Uncharacterized protein n=1 Tax=Candidatus Thiodiazotropha endoloripes TaxID=1818881 RepID=A0A1E2URZ4_9GAMM|nr:hypothetical protein [Candidatus Thiodiazotropha endoloripes]MCG7923078.1 hypothetical protein [Candidatus Thiodiazotropha lotti]MCG8004604.1 hypothetical protein [Candidatus Thiodiazotropha lotti]MCG8006622.1 hypothetical protein [Candidatus Thiodiazotropha lotti]MCW4188231.1 hypothetical protein [Candidatus Thiodiazotropha lotti]MCW4194204.1 hypothetical protein [Candidatus Thiodiazotropha lotti]